MTATSKNELQYYPEAGKLIVTRLPWTDEDGEMHEGNSVTFDVAALLDSDRHVQTMARLLLGSIVEKIDKQASDRAYTPPLKTV